MWKPVQLGIICDGAWLYLKKDQRKLSCSISANNRAFSEVSGNVSFEGPIRFFEENLMTFTSFITGLNDRRLLFCFGELMLSISPKFPVSF